MLGNKKWKAEALKWKEFFFLNPPKKGERKKKNHFAFRGEHPCVSLLSLEKRSFSFIIPQIKKTRHIKQKFWGWKLFSFLTSPIYPCTQPPMVVYKMKTQLEYAHVACTFFALLAPTCMLSRCLLTKFLRRSSVGSLLSVRCWLGKKILFKKKIKCCLSLLSFSSLKFRESSSCVRFWVVNGHKRRRESHLERTNIAFSPTQRQKQNLRALHDHQQNLSLFVFICLEEGGGHLFPFATPRTFPHIKRKMCQKV